jgi:hypothetical protein
MEVVGGKDSTFFKHVFICEILLITKIETREHEKGNNIQVIKMKKISNRTIHFHIIGIPK